MELFEMKTVAVRLPAESAKRIGAGESDLLQNLGVGLSLRFAGIREFGE